MKRLFGCAVVMLAFLVVLATILACGTGLYSTPPSPPASTSTPVTMTEPTTQPEHTAVPTPEHPPTPTTVPPTPMPSPTTEETPTATPPPTSTAEAPTPSPEPSPTREAPTTTPPASQVSPHLTVAVQSLTGEALNSVMDGNGLLLVAGLENPTDTPMEDTVRFTLDSIVEPITTCRLQALPGSTGTCSATVAADGWAWQDHQRLQQRTLLAALEPYQLTASVSVGVRPKPVVLVHGTNSGAWAWQAWTDMDGFLAARGL